MNEVGSFHLWHLELSSWRVRCCFSIFKCSISYMVRMYQEDLERWPVGLSWMCLSNACDFVYYWGIDYSQDN